MKVLISVIACVSVLQVANSMQTQDLQTVNKVHLYVLMVPDSAVQKLVKFRQDEDGGSDFTETGAYVGQIISGVLGGNVSNIFAGGLSFIPSADVEEGVGTILANVAPTVSSILRGWGNRVSNVLGINSTPRPGIIIINGTSPSNATVAGQQQPSAGSQPAPTTLLPLIVYPPFEATTVEGDDEESDSISALPK
ncbi:hypothetical protein Ocin01_05501 [Orchesella cincta]|uniref:Uncharacterized protein n=1 Tax=Orchesella cincta TaxID=48709 RepID=A0A1D2N854_ORCCI|nr:hypothetical protein Ocin01_05501 [Orchesella cincta]